MMPPAEPFSNQEYKYPEFQICFGGFKLNDQGIRKYKFGSKILYLFGQIFLRVQI